MRTGLSLVLALALLTPLAAAPLQDQVLRDAIVKIYTVHDSPHYYNPWSMQGPRSSTGSGCVIRERRILTNAHVVSDRTFVQVRRNGESRRHLARVVDVSHDADLALLTVDDESFFEGVEPVEIGALPEGQEEVLVYGFPLGGDSLSITKGVVSRIEHRPYAHSSVHLLAGQIDAAINPGNSGGPVIMDGKLAGVVMQSIRQADNIGYMVPSPIVQHFLADLEDGAYHGFPSIGVLLQGMENPDLKRKYAMDDTRTGMLIVNVLPGSPAEGVLERGDVLLAIEGHDIADDGTVEFRPRQRTSVSYYVQRHQVGEAAELTILRGGEERRVHLELDRPLNDDWLVPMERYDVLPTYYVFGGVVFCPLTKNLLEAWGGNWYNSAPKELVALLSSNYPDEKDEEVVLVLKVLADEVNRGYHDFSNWVVKRVNGQPVLNMAGLVRAVEGDAPGAFVVFENEGGQQIVLDRAKAEERGEEILRTYRVPADRSPDLAAAEPDPVP